MNKLYVTKIQVYFDLNSVVYIEIVGKIKYISIDIKISSLSIIIESDFKPPGQHKRFIIE